MYAVIKTGGKQYKVSSGDKLKVEFLSADLGSELVLEEVLAVGDVAGGSVSFGAPFVNGARVRATVLSHGRGPKIRIFKLRRRKHYKRQQGHRQYFTELQIENIEIGA